jgi:hypothetical protein
MVTPTTKIRIGDGSIKVPYNREFDNKTYHFFTYECSMGGVHQEMDDRKEQFYIRVLKIPNNKGYVVYVRDKKTRGK